MFLARSVPSLVFPTRWPCDYVAVRVLAVVAAVVVSAAVAAAAVRKVKWKIQQYKWYIIA